MIILWFITYFVLGDKVALTFTNKSWAEIFPQILVFAAAVSIYALFILAIKTKRKKWVNFLLFFGGMFVAIVPFLAYHGYYQYQCGIWNQEIVTSRNLLINHNDHSETVKIVRTKCEFEEEIKVDTLYSKKTTDFFELQHKVELIENKGSSWKLDN